MNVKIQSVKFNADKKLLDYTTSKVEKLGLFFDDILGADVVLSLDNSDDNKNKLAEIKLMLPGSSPAFAKRQCKTFEEAVDEASEALRVQLKKVKDKQRK